MSPENSLTFALAIYTLGVAMGDFYLESANVNFRRFGRAVKISSSTSAGLFALNPVVPFSQKWGSAPTLGFIAISVLCLLIFIYEQDRAGKLKPLDN